MSAEGSQDSGGGGEDPFSSLLLEELKQRLLQAFRAQSPGHAARGGAQRTGRAAEAPSGDRTSALAAREELRRAHLEGAMAWLRVELLEMKSQNEKLARTLLDLSMEIRQLRNENDMPATLESETLNPAKVPE